jgi:hypothetical protein
MSTHNTSKKRKFTENTVRLMHPVDEHNAIALYNLRLELSAQLPAFVCEQVRIEQDGFIDLSAVKAYVKGLDSFVGATFKQTSDFVLLHKDNNRNHLDRLPVELHMYIADILESDRKWRERCYICQDIKDTQCPKCCVCEMPLSCPTLSCNLHVATSCCQRVCVSCKHKNRIYGIKKRKSNIDFFCGRCAYCRRLEPVICNCGDSCANQEDEYEERARPLQDP